MRQQPPARQTFRCAILLAAKAAVEQAAGAAREAAQARVADAERAAEGLTRLPGEAGLTRTLAIELGPRQIMVNAIAPGMVRTPMLAGMTAGRISQLAAGYPGGRLPEAEDIAQAIAFFGDPRTMFITGLVLIIDGGRSVGLSGT